MPKVNTPEIKNKSITKEKLSNEVNEKLNNIGTMSSLKTSNKDTLVNSINELFQSASNGKTLVANAITGKGVQSNSNMTFQQLATNISNIKTGYGKEEIESGKVAVKLFFVNRATSEKIHPKYTLKQDKVNKFKYCPMSIFKTTDNKYILFLIDNDWKVFSTADLSTVDINNINTNNKEPIYASEYYESKLGSIYADSTDTNESWSRNCHVGCDNIIVAFFERVEYHGHGSSDSLPYLRLTDSNGREFNINGGLFFFAIDLDIYVINHSFRYNTPDGLAFTIYKYSPSGEIIE